MKNINEKKSDSIVPVQNPMLCQTFSTLQNYNNNLNYKQNTKKKYKKYYDSKRF